jgi:septal ring factor EnvC (AmiA/AmiB activator)
MRVFRFIALALGLLAGVSPVAFANNDPVFAARRAAEELQSATRALADAKDARDRVSALSQTIKAYEDGLQAMRESLRKAAIREKSLRLQFDARRDQLSRLLGVLQTIQRASSPLLLIHPSGPLGTARSGQILSEVTPALHRQAEDLRLQLEELLLLQALQTSAKEDLEAGLKGVQDARIALSAAIGERTDLPLRFVSDEAQLKSLVQDSETLEGFANGLSDLPFDGAPEKAAPFSSAKGNLPLPVFGTVLRRFKEADAAGLRRPGLILSAPPVSLVTAPWPATIRYRGPLLDYGNVIILEPQSGYLLVLAGLGQVYGEVGEIVSAGDPVGLMSGTDPAAKDFLVEASQGSGEIRNETLYIEIRQDRNAVDPGAWFALRDR